MSARYDRNHFAGRYAAQEARRGRHYDLSTSGDTDGPSGNAGRLSSGPITPVVALTTPERDVLSSVLEYLGTQKRRVAWFRRMNVGGFYNASGQFVRAGFVGCSDIIGQMLDGRFLAVECKRPGKLPTPEQWEFLSMVNRNRGVAIVAASIDDVRRVIEA